MSITVVCSPKNSVKLVQKDLIVPDQYAYVHPSKTLFIDSLQIDQSASIFRQPVCRVDTICIQYKRGKVGTDAWNYQELQFFDIDGRLIDTFGSLPFTHTITGEVDEFGEPVYWVMYKFRPQDLAYLAAHQVISIVLAVHFGDGFAEGVGDTVMYLVSNPIELATRHPGTRLIEYSNTVNDKKTLFEFPQIFPKFMIRVPASQMKLIPAGDYDVAEDMRNKLTVLNATAYNKYKMEVGPVPYVMVEILNEVVKCVNIRIDGDEYSAEAEQDDDPMEDVLVVKTYTFRDRDDDDRVTFDQVQYLVWERPASGFNYGITRTWMSDWFDFFYVNYYALNDNAGETGLLGTLNASAAAVGCTGTFIQIGTKFYFKNGAGQRYRPVVYPTILPYELNITFNVTDIAYAANLSLWYATAGDRAVLLKETAGSGAAEVFGDTGVIINVAKTYGSTGAKTWRLFHNDEFTEIRLGGSASAPYPKVTNITGHISAHLKRHDLFYADLSGHVSFPLTYLARCRNSLTHLIIRNSKLKAVTAGWASGLVTGTVPNLNKPFPLEYIDFRNNELPSAEVDAIVIEAEYDTKYKSGPYQLMIDGQTPPAPPTGAATAALDDFNLAGWQTDTD